MVPEYKWDNLCISNEGRKFIDKIGRKKGKVPRESCCGSNGVFFSHECSLNVVCGFFRSINILVILQLAIGVTAVYAVRYFQLWMTLNSSIIVSPIVFPLAFAINIDFQRREKILQHLGDFKASLMIFYFCMRDWGSASGLNADWMQSMKFKLTCLSINIREYLVADNFNQRKAILTVIYRDFRIINQLLLKIRSSKLPNNGPLLSRLIQTLTNMMSSFECLQAIREYRSSRAIRSFNKVMVFMLPLLLSPYFVYLGRESGNEWASYYISIVAVFIFSALQGVHDKLDNPFDGMGEDDVDMNSFEEWAIETLEVMTIEACQEEEIESFNSNENKIKECV